VLVREEARYIGPNESWKSDQSTMGVDLDLNLCLAKRELFEGQIETMVCGGSSDCQCIVLEDC
jgi:hypothetical protein